MAEQSKFIQIAAVPANMGGFMMFALDDAGQVWRHESVWLTPQGDEGMRSHDFWIPLDGERRDAFGREAITSVPPTPGAKTWNENDIAY